MTERKYTLSEIDKMRRLVRDSMRPKLVASPAMETCGINMAPPIDYSVSPALVEDRLRTYMIAGLGPDDLMVASASPSEEACTGDGTPQA